MSNPFSYCDHDLAVFDMDRCIIIDSDRDYEDVLLICELANYQFLELRTLDKLLDRWLDEAEDDVNAISAQAQRARSIERPARSAQEVRQHPGAAPRRPVHPGEP